MADSHIGISFMSKRNVSDINSRYFTLNVINEKQKYYTNVRTNQPLGMKGKQQT